MKALIYEGPREMHLREVEVPVPGDDEVLIRIAYSGICGSELSGYYGHNSLRKPPLIFGHEFSGTIAALGERAGKDTGLQIGIRVTANPLVTCGRCPTCLQGRQQLCVSRKLLSAALPGSNAEYVKLPAQFVYPLPDSVSLELGAMTEPAACAVRAVELAEVSPKDHVLVMGLGPIGLLIVQVLSLYGVKRIFAADMNPERLEMASQWGVTAIHPKHTDVLEEVRRLTHGIGADVAIDAVGSGITRNQCIQCAAFGGRVIFTGLHEADSTLPVNTIIRNEIRCLGSFAYSSLNFETALRWLSEGRIGFQAGVVKAPLEEGGTWFEKLLTNAGSTTKVLLYPPQEGE